MTASSFTTLLRALCTSLACVLLLSAPLSSRAAADASAAASVLSALPLAVVVAAPAALVSGGAQLSMVAVEATAEGTVWVLQRASDGARASLRLAFIPNAAGAALLHNERVSK